MKYLLALTFFTSTLLHASTINLNVGDTITLQANTTTTVSCGGSNSNCSLPVKNLKAKLEYCKSRLGSSVEECLDQIWPNYKSTNNQCINEGYDTCLTFCKTSFPTLDCLTKCE